MFSLDATQFQEESNPMLQTLIVLPYHSMTIALLVMTDAQQEIRVAPL
jgi:hypothetical protein